MAGIPLQPPGVILPELLLLFLLEEVVLSRRQGHPVFGELLGVVGEPGLLGVVVEGVPLGEDGHDFDGE